MNENIVPTNGTRGRYPIEKFNVLNRLKPPYYKFRSSYSSSRYDSRRYLGSYYDCHPLSNAMRFPVFRTSRLLPYFSRQPKPFIYKEISVPFSCQLFTTFDSAETTITPFKSASASSETERYITCWFRD